VRGEEGGTSVTRALVAGGLGFIGSNLTKRLCRAGAQVIIVTPSTVAHRELAGEMASLGVEIVAGDIRDSSLMQRLIADRDVIYHLAGQSGAVRSIEDPFTDLDVNYRGTLVLLEAMRQARSTAKIVFAGSRLHYGHPQELPVKETQPAESLSMHAIHKTAAESALQVYGRLFDVRAVVARITNPYGPGQPRERTAYGVINRLVHLALAGDVLPIYGDGRQLRDYVHVDDVTAALVAMASSAAADGKTFNVGSGAGTALVDAATMIVDIAGGGRIEHVPWPELASRVETGDFVADISKIRSALGWQPGISLRQGLTQTVDFYRDQLTGSRLPVPGSRIPDPGSRRA
jgi:UDP-glucose 4-epimerase